MTKEKDYGEQTGSVQMINVQPYHKNKINGVIGFGLPVGKLMFMKVNGVKLIDFHERIDKKYTIYTCKMTEFAKRYSVYFLDRLKHVFVPANRMSCVIMSDKDSSQKLMTEYK